MMTTVHPVYSTRPSALSLYLTPPLPGAVSLHVSSGVVLRSAEGHEEGGISNDEGGRIRKRPAGGAEPRASPSGRRRPRGASDVVPEGVGEVLRPVGEGALLGDARLHGEPEHRDHREAAVLDLLHLQLRESVRAH